MKTELLAPAKNKQIAISAINSGADAVYIGAMAFGARLNASNSVADIKEIVDYAHKFYVRVYVTINTILKDEELEDVKNLIKKLYEIGVDGLIVQDFAILEMFKEGELPPIPLHASTQCDIRSIEKAEFFADLGMKRIILARELSLDKISEITKKLKTTEIEKFIHGAFCYSGQCYFSHYVGGRSANRGECAQACRKKYSLIDENNKVLLKNKHLLSLKDFNASKYIEKLCKIGVKSFKIEGRLKDEEYVKTVVLYYRNLIDKYSDKTSSGKIITDFEPVLEKAFNRGFTDYFMEKRKDCFNFDTPKSIGEKIGTVKLIGKNFIEVTGSVKINPQDGLCYIKNDLKGFLVNKVVGKKIFPNVMPDKLDIGDIIYRNLDFEYEKALKNAKISRKIGVEVYVSTEGITLTDENKNSITVPLPEGEKANNQQKADETFINQFKKTGESDFYIMRMNVKCALPFLPISKINEFRRDVFEHLMAKRLENYPKKSQKSFKNAIFPVQEIDYRANVYNERAKKFYYDHYCEVREYAPEKEKPSHTYELMRTKHCLKFAINKCGCEEKLYLIDEKGVKYPLVFDCKNCEMAVLTP